MDLDSVSATLFDERLGSIGVELNVFLEIATRIRVSIARACSVFGIEGTHSDLVLGKGSRSRTAFERHVRGRYDVGAGLALEDFGVRGASKGPKLKVDETALCVD